MEVKIKDKDGYVEADWIIEDGILVVSPKEVKFEPKDGDVVYSEGFYDFVFIYKDNLTEEAYYYVYLCLKDNKIELPDGGHIGYVSQLRPATEEEKQKLFDKLAEEGYEFDFENKELIKLKWKPKYCEVYWTPYINNSVFVPIDCTWTKSGVGNNRYKKGWCFKTKEECQVFCNLLNDAINSVKP